MFNCMSVFFFFVFFFKQKTAYDMRISDWSSDVCSSDLQIGWKASPQRISRMASQRREVALGRNMERIDIMGNSKQQAIIAVAATIVLSGCGLIKPRDAGYFRFHAEEARLVVTRCERGQRSEEHTSELQSLMRNSSAGFRLK